jgi:hypothetical protein
LELVLMVNVVLLMVGVVVVVMGVFVDVVESMLPPSSISTDRGRLRVRR